MLKTIKVFILLMLINFGFSQELVIGEERVEPGIVFIFEGAIKDHIMPKEMHLKENQSNIHIEARVNWDEVNIPDGTPEGGFVPYLAINAKIVNSNTGLSTFIDLLPHINLIDNFHYARNVALPGNIADNYYVEFNIIGPTYKELALHKDWFEKYGSTFMNNVSFVYNKVNFEEIANASR
tara:strand:+ start:409 stop:948 length:540 start_codon:yes stop_codon:yes gene_type:complete